MPTHIPVTAGDLAEWPPSGELVEVLAVTGRTATVREVETGREFVAAMKKLVWVPTQDYPPPEFRPGGKKNEGNPHTHRVDRHWRRAWGD